MRGSVLDLAVGVIIGAAFGKIVASLVDDILMPPLGRLLGHVDFSSLYLNLSDKHFDTLAAAKAAGAPTFNYGNFINTIINFLIVAFAIFMVVRSVNRWMPKPVPPPRWSRRRIARSAPCPFPSRRKKCGIAPARCRLAFSRAPVYPKFKFSKTFSP